MKKWAKFLCCFAILGAFLVGGLAGCGTVSNIKNSETELIYNGNAAAVVKTDSGKFLYFGNSFASTAPTSGEEYSQAQKLSYLARVNLDNLEAKSEYFSPKKVENVSAEVTSYDDSFTFVLGQNIYYATPNKQMVTQETDGKKDTAYHFEYTCFYKSSLNGDHKKKLYTTTGEVSQIEVLKNDSTYYLVMLAGTNLVSINLSNDKIQTLATGVTSVALPKTYQKDVEGSSNQWNGKIFFTTAYDDVGNSGTGRNVVKRISVSSTNPDDAEEVYSQGTVTFVAREGDVVFFTDTVENQQAAVYMVDATGTNNKNIFLPTSALRTKIYEGASVTASTVTDLHVVTVTAGNGEDTHNQILGYVFKAGSTWKYVTPAGKSGTINFSEDMSSATTLFVSGGRIYFATTSGIYRAELPYTFSGEIQSNVQKFASLTDVSASAPYAFCDGYLYFYAKLQELPEDQVEEDQETETDDNFYLYRTWVDGVDQFELLGMPSIQSRRTK